MSKEKHRHCNLHRWFFKIVENTMFFRNKVDQRYYDVDADVDEKCLDIDYDIKNVVSTSMKKTWKRGNHYVFPKQSWPTILRHRYPHRWKWRPMSRYYDINAHITTCQSRMYIDIVTYVIDIVTYLTYIYHLARVDSDWGLEVALEARGRRYQCRQVPDQ